MSYFNLNHQKISSAGVDFAVGYSGGWNIEIINPDRNTSIFPFGTEMKKNLLTQGFYDFFNLKYGPTPHTSSLILDSVAVVGDGDNIAAISDTRLGNKIMESSISTVKDRAGCYDNTEQGSRTFFTYFDFVPDPENDRVIKEAGIVSSGVFFSHFIFPRPIILPQYSTLRLRYELTCFIPIVKKPLEVSISRGKFSGDGFLKMIGLWDNIFGKIYSSDSLKGRTYIALGSSNFPMTNNWARWDGNGGIGAIQVNSLLGGFPEINTPAFCIENIHFEQQHFEHRYYNTMADEFIGHGICYNSYDGDVSFLPHDNLYNKRTARLKFGALNPYFSNDDWRGVIFLSLGCSNHAPYPTNRRIIYSDRILTFTTYGINPKKYSYYDAFSSCLYWRFNSPQIRHTDQYVEIDLTQSIVIENFLTDNMESISMEDRQSPIILI